jgi:hypothetical protein
MRPSFRVAAEFNTRFNATSNTARILRECGYVNKKDDFWHGFFIASAGKYRRGHAKHSGRVETTAFQEMS